MANLINEAKRFQKLAGIINENQLNEEMDIKTFDPASFLAAMDSTDPKNQSLIQNVKQATDADMSKRYTVVNKLRDYAKANTSNKEIQDKFEKAIAKINEEMKKSTKNVTFLPKSQRGKVKYPDPILDPLSRGTALQIRICTKTLQIQNTG
jgi:hypothetical protein